MRPAPTTPPTRAPRRARPRRRPALAAVLAAAQLALAALLAPAALAATAPVDDGTDDGGTGGNGGLNQVIDPNQQQATERVVLDAGHIDFGPTLSTGEWRVQIHDDTSTPRYWRMPADVAIRVSDGALLTVPDDDAYAFLGVEPGTEVHVVPQTQKSDVIWTGWNTQEPNVLEQVELGATMSLVGFEGPGDLSVYLQSGNFGAPQVLYSTRDALPQSTWIELNTHTHANWVFTQPGTYLVELQFEADLRDGTRVAAHDTLRFSVGDATPVEEAYSAQYSDAALRAGDTGTDADAAAPAPGGGSGVPDLVWIGAGVLGGALLVAVVVMVAANARMRRRVREARAARAAQDAEAATAAARGGAPSAPPGEPAPPAEAPGDERPDDATGPDTPAPARPDAPARPEASAHPEEPARPEEPAQ